MKRKKNAKRLSALGMTICMTFLMSACQIGERDIVITSTLNNKEVFQIDNSVCELKEAMVYLANYQNIYGTAYSIDLWNHDFGEASLEDYIKDITLAELTSVYSMNLLAKEQQMSLSEDELQKVTAAAEEYYDTLSWKEISYMEVSEDDIEEYYGHYALAQKLYNSLTDGVNEEVSDDEARVIEIMQIFVENDLDANIVTQKLANGDDFATIANNYNELSAIQVTVSRDDLPDEVEQVAFRLDNDEVSSAIAVENGYYFVKCLNKYNVELTEANKENIVEKRQNEAFDDVYHEFISTKESYLNMKLWDTITLEIDEEIATDRFFAIFEKHCSDI